MTPELAEVLSTPAVELDYRIETELHVDERTIQLVNGVLRQCVDVDIARSGKRDS